MQAAHSRQLFSGKTRSVRSIKSQSVKCSE
jgi:hypothetical protein